MPTLIPCLKYSPIGATPLASFALDAGALRGAVGEYAEKRAYKNMATNNDNLDAMAGQDGYPVGVLRDYEKMHIFTFNCINNNK